LTTIPLDSNGHTPSLSQSLPQSSEKQQILTGTSSSTDPEELSQSAEVANPVLFQRQKQNKFTRNRKEGRGEDEENRREQSSRQFANSNILLPYSQYEQMLLERALAEHKFVAEEPQKQQKLEMETNEKARIGNKYL
jgi:hypothetical protein